jgi:L-ascorbate metabolism protein UlaG (beta-lactamase superfamily)
MEFVYLGHSSFRITAVSSFAGVKQKVSIITDPFDPEMVGLKFPANEADIVTISHEHSDHNYTQKISGIKKVVSGPGEYEIRGVSIMGFQSFHDNQSGSIRGKNTIYLIEAEGLKVLHLGDLGHKLSDDLVDKIGDVDVLMIPVGGEFTIGPKEAVEAVNKIEPFFVIPMHYKVPLPTSQFDGLEPVESFLKESSFITENLPKFSVKKEEISDDQNTKAVVLEIKH